MANGKPKTRQDTENGILKSETKVEKFCDLIEKHICDRQTQNLRLQDSLLGCARSETWEEFAETSHFSEDHSRSPIIQSVHCNNVVKRQVLFFG